MRSVSIYQTIAFILLSVILFSRSYPLDAQDIELNARLESSVILIGDQTTLTLEATVPLSYRIVWPEVADTLIRQIEVINKSGIDTVRQSEASGNMILTQRMVITSFDSGYFAIPPFLFLFQKPGAVDFEAMETEALLLEVDNPDVDLAGDIKDIKGPLKAPVTFAEIWPWLLAGLIVAGGVLFYIYYRRRRKKSQPLVVFRRKPVQPAHIIALDELEKLRARKLWQSGKVKQYHTELTDIVRNYITAKFGIHAIEMVTHDIIESVEGTAVTQQTRSKLKEMLELADLVKFAKENPLPDEQERSMNQAIDFVKESIHTVEEIPPEGE